MYDFARDNPIDRDQLRERLQRMTDDALLRFGRSARYMCSPQANAGKPPREAFVVQLEEALAEWHRRHPKNPDSTRPHTSLTSPVTRRFGDRVSAPSADCRS
jgi:hypothetical protein